MMTHRRRAMGALVILGLAVSGCASIIEGRSQQIVVNTNPAGADCGLYRQTIRLGIVQNAPGSILIEKTKHDIWLACVKLWSAPLVLDGVRRQF
jgi:hypothetical protein